MKKKLYKTVIAAFLSCCLASGCMQVSSDGNASDSTIQASVGSSLSASNSQTSELFTNRDLEVGYVESEAVKIILNGDSVSCDSPNVSVEGTVVTLRAAGTYLISGVLNSGQLIVDAGKEDKLQVVLAGADITCESSAPLYVKQADKVVVTLDNETQNQLSISSDFAAIDDNNIDAVLYSKDDLTLNGNGSLKIAANYGSGIVSKDDLTITGGTYEITAAEHALSGKDNVKISDGNFVLQAGKDGIHSENKDDTSLGFLYIGSGDFDINAQGDGLDSATTLQIESGTFSIRSGSGSEGTVNADVSTKGIKAGGDITITDGTFTIDSTDDALHSNANVSITAGAFQILSGDDGIHADSNVTIKDGTIVIGKSYEGIEGESIDITGGEITLKSSDDGLNAAGGKDASALGERPGRGSFGSGNAAIRISGGKIVIDAGGDGVDSNGSVTISGGETYVNGPTGNGNSALDSDGTATITGGIFLAAGPSGMAQGFSSESTQGTILYGFGENVDGEFTLKDSNGEIVTSFTPSKQYSMVIISVPQLLQGQTYTLKTDTAEHEIVMDSLHYSTGVSGGFGGRGGGMKGGRPMAPPEGSEPPQGTPPSPPQNSTT